MATTTELGLRTIGTVGRYGLAAIGTFVVYILAFFFFVPSSGWQSVGHELLTMLEYAVIGSVTVLWCRTVVLVVFPSALAFFWSLGALKWSIHLTDTRGEYAPPMWQYILSPSLQEVRVGLLATVGAASGWLLTSMLLERRARRTLTDRR